MCDTYRDTFFCHQISLTLDQPMTLLNVHISVCRNGLVDQIRPSQTKSPFFSKRPTPMQAILPKEASNAHMSA